MELTLSSEVVHVPLAGLRELGFPPVTTSLLERVVEGSRRRVACGVAWSITWLPPEWGDLTWVWSDVSFCR